MIADILQTYVPICLIILLNWIFQLQYEGVWQLLILYPIAIVPWTYLTSFLFSRDFVAQIMTVSIHFLVGGLIPPVIFLLQNIPWTANLGDSMRWWFTFIPSFCVGEGIVWSATYETLNLARTGLIAVGFDVNPVNTHVYAMVNLGGTYTIMLGTFFVCTLLLFVIESDCLVKCTAHCSLCRKPMPRYVEDPDEDVVAEEERIFNQLNGGAIGDADGAN